ncbi:hypothetical protein Pfo_004969 [Paulownia fortunei]|nr:hypothetical protein Pfo_004969 [Paulownia fortunei]
MERSEPTLVPEWLKNAGSLSGGGSISYSDDQTAVKLARNKSFVNSDGLDFGRSFSSDRTTSSYFRRSSSSNGSGLLRSHSSFGRNKHDRDWEKDTYDSRDKDKSVLGNRRHQDSSDALGNTLLSKFERDGVRHSQLTVSGKRADTWHKKVVTDLSTNSGNNTNSLITKGSPTGEVNKTTFERDFPSLGAEERAFIPEVGRVSSPGLVSVIQTLPIGTSTIISGEKWTSALAEVPVLVGSNGTGISSVQQAAPSSSTSVALGTTTSLNMAEAVAQGPIRAQTTPQLSVGTQRLEELAIKQSRQLIPVTPSMPKTLVLNSSDKQKNKMGQQQHPSSSSLAVNHSPRGGPVKGDVSKASNVGKLHVLKPVREKNGAIPFVKDNLSPTSGSKLVNSTLVAPSVSGSAATRGPLNSPVADRKPVLNVLEKRPTSQAQSRNDFFNSVRKKSMANSSSVADSTMANSSSVADSTMENSSSFADSSVANSLSVLDTGSAASPSFSDKLAEMVVVRAPNASQAGDASSGVSLSGDHLSEMRAYLTCNGDACDALKHVSNGGKHPSSDPIFSEEEEAAFLRSLGWEENADEGGLTEEEINAFFRDISKYINSKPSLKILQGVQPKFLLPFDSHIGGIGGISSGLSSSDTKLES